MLSLALALRIASNGGLLSHWFGSLSLSVEEGAGLVRAILFSLGSSGGIPFRLFEIILCVIFFGCFDEL